MKWNIFLIILFDNKIHYFNCFEKYIYSFLWRQWQFCLHNISFTQQTILHLQWKILAFPPSIAWHQNWTILWHHGSNRPIWRQYCRLFCPHLRQSVYWLTRTARNEIIIFIAFFMQNLKVCASSSFTRFFLQPFLNIW